MSRTPAVVLDAAALVAFVVIGNASHGGLGDVANLAIIVAPFIIGWFATALVAKLYAEPLSLARTGLTFVIALPVAYLLRALVFGRGVPLVFVLVTTAFLALVIFGWRLVALGVTRMRARRRAPA